MAKQSGLGMRVQVDDAGGVARNISNDLDSIDFSTPRGTQDITGLDKSAMETLLLLADGKATFKGTLNAAANMSHDVFKTVPSTSVTRTVTIDLPPLVTGSPRLAMEMVLTDYQVTRGNDGKLTFSVPAQLADGTVPTWATQP